MYQWYKGASVCYAYLADVQNLQTHSQFEKEFRESRWFKRGWTLQELVAPKVVKFYNAEWNSIGTKSDHKKIISEITGIDIRVLQGADPATCNVAQRMSWASARETTRVEDKAYSLLGLFGVNMPMIYGEKEDAYIRLQEEILKTTEDYSIFAWHDHEADDESNVSSKRRGILAYTPANFCPLTCQKCTRPRSWDYPDLEHIQYDVFSGMEPGSNPHRDLPSLSARGLKLNLPTSFSGTESEQAYVYLYCRVGPERKRLCLVLSTDDVRRYQYRRVGLQSFPVEDCTNFKLAVVYVGASHPNIKAIRTSRSVLGIL